MICLARLDKIAQGLAPSVDTVVELDEDMAEQARVVETSSQPYEPLSHLWRRACARAIRSCPGIVPRGQRC